MPIGDVKALLEKEDKRKSDKKWLQRIHHILMKEYGWIPMEEFKELYLPTMWNLLEEIKQDREEERKAIEKAKRGR